MVGVLPNKTDSGLRLSSPIIIITIPNANEKKKPFDAIRTALLWRFAPNSREM